MPASGGRDSSHEPGGGGGKIGGEFVRSHKAQVGLLPLGNGIIRESTLLDEATISCSEVAGEELLFVNEEVSVSSGIVANFLRTCLSAGRRIGLL